MGTVAQVLSVLLQRTKSWSGYLDEIKLGPITKMVDRSATVRSLAFEVMTDLIEYDNAFMLLLCGDGKTQFVPLFMERMMEGIESEDGALINAQKECFQMLL